MKIEKSSLKIEKADRQDRYQLRKAMQTIRTTHTLLESGYRFDDEKGPMMLAQIKSSIDLIENRFNQKAN